MTQEEGRAFFEGMEAHEAWKQIYDPSKPLKPKHRDTLWRFYEQVNCTEETKDRLEQINILF